MWVFTTALLQFVSLLPNPENHSLQLHLHVYLFALIIYHVN